MDHSYRVCVVIVGGSIVAVGLITIPLPGPGWLIVIAGLFVLATEFLLAGRPVWLRVLLAAVTAAFVYGVLVVTLHMIGVPDWTPGWVPLWR